MKLGGGKEWFTAAELADLRLPGLPRAKRKVNDLAAAEAWSIRTGPNGEKMVRPRKGRGGGWEYHIDVLPVTARAALLKLGVGAVAHVAPKPETHADGLWRWLEGQSDKTKEEARRRLKVLQLVASYEQLGLNRSASVANAAARMKIGASTIWGWFELVSGVGPADWLPHLAPRRVGGAAEAAIDALAWQYFLSDYLRPEQPTFSSAYRRTRDEFAAPRGITVPHERTFRRKLEREVPLPVITVRRMGEEALRRSLPPQQRTVAELCALEAVNIDGHKFDVFVQWPDGRIGRPIMVAVQDIFSRKFLSWRIDESESALVTRLVFADLFRDWGIPKHCILDNGRAFAAKSITGAAKSRFRFKIREDEPTGVLTALGVQIHWAMPYRGQSKPIERAFRDLCDTIARHPAMAGAYTGNRPDAKPENYGSKAIPIDVFRALVDKGMAAHNAREGRRTEMTRGGSFDATFAESYARSAIGRATPEQMRLALLTAEERPCDRKTSHVTLEGNRYWAPELSAHAGEKLIVRFDPDNLHGSVHCYTRDDRYICEAPVYAAVGFLDKAGSKARAKLEREYRRAAKEAEAKLDLIRTADLAALLPDHIDETDPIEPSVVRPVRFVGNAAVKLSSDTHRAAATARQAARMADVDASMAGLTKLRAVK
ncbi:MAG: hypothetical protein CVT77_06455 [Alphaproteobacteria bacterium HGW-Alphaproteobacteria-16]|nr:MAG: hypothetical protein CVT77_06455 [Alphaproteobacteria bacterium HGW-Alphaproteobacteria-16]